MKTRAYVHSSKVVSARALENVDLKKGYLSCRIDCYSYMARFGTKHAGQAISRAYGKSNSLFLVKFCYILPACLTKNRLYTFKIVHLNAVITLSNNKQNKYSNSIYKIYLKPCHDHCILPTYFQNNKKTRNDLARRLFTLKRFQYCRFQNTFQLAFFPSLLSTCRSRLLFASLRERRKFGVDQRITINMGVNLCHSVVPQASNVILQCMHVYKVILSHSNGSSSARRLEVDGRLHNY